MKTLAKADDFEKEVECFGESKLFRASWMRSRKKEKVLTEQQNTV